MQTRSSQQLAGRRQDVGSQMATEPDAISLEDILQHAERVRRVALALVRNSDDANDLAQETWEAALTRPPREAGPLRPWLVGVARNLSRMRARSSGRRVRREEAVGRAGA